MKNYLIISLSLLTIVLYSCSQQPSKNATERAELTDSVQTNNSENLNLPQPYATKSATNLSRVIGWDEDTTPKAPAGFTVSRFAGDLDNPRWIYVLPNGDVLVAETRKNEKVAEKLVKTATGQSTLIKNKLGNHITLFRDKDNDGNPEFHSILLQNLHMPFGMLLLNNHLYVANADAIWRYPYKTGDTTITAKGEKIIDLPGGGRHWTKNIIANADGSKIYIAVGSASDHAEDGIEKEERRACILEINPDGSGERLYASGLRNPVGMDWAPGTSTLWTAVNERDELGNDLPPDYITSVKEGGFYGWPYSYFGQNKDPRIKEEEQRPDLVKRAIVPDVPVGAHTASLGLVFYTKNTFPQKYRNGIFIGQHGSWNREPLSGYKVVFVPFNNNKPGSPEDFLTGFVADESASKVYGRPVGVAVMNNGDLLVADDAGNSVWRVSYTK